MAVFILFTVLLVGVAAVGWMGFVWIERKLFSENDRFQLVNLYIRGGEVITGDLIREYTRIHEGMNLFNFDATQIRSDLLKKAPNVRSVDITRKLPDTLYIEVIERIPLARLGWNGHLVVDGEGAVFGVRSVDRGLAVILGCRADDLRPGMRLEGMGLAAVHVLDVCDDPRLGIAVESIEIGGPEYLLVHLAGDTSVKLRWDYMREMTSRSRKKLLMKIYRIADTLRSKAGRKIKWVDATIDGKLYAR